MIMDGKQVSGFFWINVSIEWTNSVNLYTNVSILHIKHLNSSQSSVSRDICEQSCLSC